jgi:hypothetical protein
MMFVSFNGNTTGGAANPSGTPSVLSGGRVAQSLVFCRLLFVLSFSDIELSVLLWFTSFNYPFDCFILFRWPQLFKKKSYSIQVIVRDLIVNFEPKSNCQYHLSSFVRNWQNTFQQSVDIFWKTFLKNIKRDNY